MLRAWGYWPLEQSPCFDRDLVLSFTKTNSWRVFFHTQSWRHAASFWEQMTDRLIKGLDFCSVHQHHLSCLSEGTQFLAPKCSHSSLSFILSLYFNKLIVKVFLNILKVIFKSVGPPESFCFPHEQMSQPPALRGSRMLLSDPWVGCPLHFFQLGAVWCAKLSLSRIFQKHTKQELCTLKAQLFTNPLRQPQAVSVWVLEPRRADSAMGLQVKDVARFGADGAELPCFVPGCDIAFALGSGAARTFFSPF